MTPTQVMVCIGCGGPREIDLAGCTPGIIPYLPCAACGERGIIRQDDQPGHGKKGRTA